MRKAPIVGTAAIVVALAGTLIAASPAIPQARSTYTFYVAAESDDIVEKIAFGPGGLRLIKSIEVGSWPTEIEGPHGLGISPDGEYWYLSLAHVQPGPHGSVVKYATEDDAWLGEVAVGMFPATLAVSPSIGLLYVANFNLHGLPEPSSISVVDPESMTEVGEVAVGMFPATLAVSQSIGLLYVANFNLHGLPEPSSISVVDTESMTEVGQVDVGVMPHGARMNREGSRLYSVNMMDNVLVEVNTYRMEVSRQLDLTPEMVKPTWATAPTPQGKIYVAGNGAAKILEIDVEDWEITRQFETPAGPYNLDVSADGTLLAATYKSSRAVGFWNLETGEEVGRVETLRPIPHGIVISPDARYAFATIEGVGGEPGSVEAYDLTTFERVGNLDIAKQAGGIAFWKID